MFSAMYGGKGNVDESQVCLQCAWVGTALLSSLHFSASTQNTLPPDLVCVLSDRGRGRWADSKASSEPSVRNTKSQVHTGFRQGEVERCFCRMKREERNYFISTELNRQELNICSEASSNIIQVRGDSTVIRYPCVSFGSKENRQRTCIYHSSILLTTLDTLRKKALSMESMIPLLF